MFTTLYMATRCRHTCGSHWLFSSPILDAELFLSRTKLFTVLHYCVIVGIICFNRTAAILVKCNGECNLGRAAKTSHSSSHQTIQPDEPPHPLVVLVLRCLSEWRWCSFIKTYSSTCTILTITRENGDWKQSRAKPNTLNYIVTWKVWHLNQMWIIDYLNFVMVQLAISAVEWL